MNHPLIRLSDTYVRYPSGVQALNGINLDVADGEFVFVVGPSGAGKSTLLKLLTGEIRPSAGVALVNAFSIAKMKKRSIPKLRRTIGVVYQDFRLIEHMTVYDNVAFAMRVVGASPKMIKKRVPYILSLVGLQHKAKHYPTEMSGGERQRVGLARALVNNPSMIIADEPTGNIDPALSFEIVDLLSEINRRGTTVLMVTHEHSLVKHFHKRIIQIHSGEIVADTAAIAREQQAAAAISQDTETVDREAIRRAKEARQKADDEARRLESTREFSATDAVLAGSEDDEQADA